MTVSLKELKHTSKQIYDIISLKKARKLIIS